MLIAFSGLFGLMKWTTSICCVQQKHQDWGAHMIKQWLSIREIGRFYEMCSLLRLQKGPHRQSSVWGLSNPEEASAILPTQVAAFASPRKRLQPKEEQKQNSRWVACRRTDSTVCEAEELKPLPMWSQLYQCNISWYIESYLQS